MFEIHGIFKKNENKYIERLQENLTSFSTEEKYDLFSPREYQGNFVDLTQSFEDFGNNIAMLSKEKNNMAVLPDIEKVVKFYEPFCEKIILRNLKTESFFSNITLEEIKTASEFYKDFKNKILIELSGKCYDYNMLTLDKTILTNNQAILKSVVHKSKICYDSFSGNSYFTYLSEKNTPKFVWLENTKSLSEKHNLIKELGFCGICWESPHTVSEGNWESLYMAYRKR